MNDTDLITLDFILTFSKPLSGSELGRGTADGSRWWNTADSSGLLDNSGSIHGQGCGYGDAWTAGFHSGKGQGAGSGDGEGSRYQFGAGFGVSPTEQWT